MGIIKMLLLLALLFILIVNIEDVNSKRYATIRNIILQIFLIAVFLSILVKL